MLYRPRVLSGPYLPRGEGALLLAEKGPGSCGVDPRRRAVAQRASFTASQRVRFSTSALAAE
jgi:hypothetical protein